MISTYSEQLNVHPFVEDFNLTEHTFDVDISTHEIDGTLYIQIGGCVMSIQELRKYRQVCVSNASFLYYAEFVFALLQLIITLFTKSVFTIACGVGSVVSSILLILSLRIVSRWYNVIAGCGITLGICTSALLTYSFFRPESMTSITQLFSTIFALFFFFLLFSLTYYAQRLQTILHVTPKEYRSRLA